MRSGKTLFRLVLIVGGILGAWGGLVEWGGFVGAIGGGIVGLIVMLALFVSGAILLALLPAKERGKDRE